MCQQVLLCPEAQALFRDIFPLLIGLVICASILLFIEVKKTYALFSAKRQLPAQQVIQTSYSLLAQAQEIVENAELQYLTLSEPVAK